MVNFKAGKYYVGDPCYVINNEHWDELGEQTNWFQKSDNFEFKGKTCFTSGTAYGDGYYYDDEGREYGVDAGLIGVVPFECIDDNFKGEGGQIIEFIDDFTAYEEDGKFYIDNFVIDTKCEEDEEYEYDNNNEEPTEEDYFEYLDELRDSGATNMFGAKPYLMNEFPKLTKEEAGKILSNWMSSYSDRH